MRGPKTCLYEERIETERSEEQVRHNDWPKTCLYEERIETTRLELGQPLLSLGRRPATMKRGLRLQTCCWASTAASAAEDLPL